MDTLTDEQLKRFEDNGYVVLEDFATEAEIEAMKSSCKKIVDEMEPSDHTTVFSTTKHSHRNDYFINSADKISFFFEENAKDKDGNLLFDKYNCINKIGHALHKFCPAFKSFTFSDKVQNVARKLGFIDPIICQSMYIFKPPKIGGPVVPHQDGSFLYLEPLKVVGLWLALEDATIENGCLWFIPGSHKDGIHNGRRMIKNPDITSNKTAVFTAREPTYDDSKFVAAPIKKGSLIVIHGTVVHKSEKNDSDNSRNIYTFHFYEQHKAVWSDQNWLQPTEAEVFSPLYQEI